ncbi:MAG: J domain-containing protein [Acidobacteriota bacterium]
MSHYARLKVTQDAPVEVIRAAYRVLAAKYHPDRQAVTEAASASSHDDANAEMAALNTAYQVLINPQTRRDYDALLDERKALRKSKAATRAAAHEAAAAEAVMNTRVDMEWLPPKSADDHKRFRRSRRLLFMGGSLTGVLAFGLAIGVWQLIVQSQMEQALSDQYAARPTASVPPEPAVMPALLKMVPSEAPPARPAPEVASAAPAASRNLPSVTDLSKLSNEELAQLLPVLSGGSLARHRRERHPLDGQPLNLRQDGQLIEILP